MLHLAERVPGTLLPDADSVSRAIALERFFYFVTDVIGPNHAGFYLRGIQKLDAAAMLDERSVERLSSAERYVAQSSFMAGDRLTIVDISAFTTAAAVKAQLPWARLPNLERWFQPL
jgi:GSH-dependent disulfide-bond oxidoreductase